MGKILAFGKGYKQALCISLSLRDILSKVFSLVDS